MFSGQIIFKQAYKSPGPFVKSFPKSFEKLKVRGEDGNSNGRDSPATKAGKDITEAKIQSNSKFNTLVSEAENVLLKIQTVFPFKLFPTYIIITPTKIDIVDQTFFFSEHVHSIMIKDVSDIMADTALFFSDLKIVDRWYTENIITISWLWKDEALKARDIIQGLITSDKAGVDIVSLDQYHLSEKAEYLGRIQGVPLSTP